MHGGVSQVWEQGLKLCQAGPSGATVFSSPALPLLALQSEIWAVVGFFSWLSGSVFCNQCRESFLYSLGGQRLYFAGFVRVNTASSIFKIPELNRFSPVKMYSVLSKKTWEGPMGNLVLLICLQLPLIIMTHEWKHNGLAWTLGGCLIGPCRFSNLR